MADTVIAASLQLDSTSADQSVKSFKQQLKEAQAEALKLADSFGPTSKEALTAAKHVANLKDQFQDVKETAALFDPGAKFQVFGNVLRTVAGGFSALTGTMALFGEQSEEVQKSLLKVQAALALVEGVNTIADSVKDFERLKAVIAQTTVFQKANAIATNVTSGAMRLLGISVDTTAASFQVLKGAIIATGIGALIVAIGVVVEAFENWTSAAQRAEEAQKNLNETIAKGAQAQLEGEMAFISRQEKLQKARAEARGATEKEINEIQVYWQKQRLKAQVGHFNEVKNADEKAAGESLNRAKDIEVDIQITQLQYQKKQLEQKKEHDKKLSEEAKAAAKKEKEEREQQLKEAENAELKGLELLRKLREELLIAQTNDEVQQAILRVRLAAQAERRTILEEANISADLRSELLAASRERERAEVEEIEKRGKEEELQKEEERKAKDAERLEIGKNAVLANMMAVAEARKKDADEQKAIDEAVYQQKVALAQSSANALGAIADLVGRNTAAGKVAALAELAVNTGLGFSNGLRIAQEGAKVGGPLAPYLFPIFYATQVAAVLGAAAKAKSIISSGSSSGAASPITSVGTAVSSAQAPLAPVQTVTTTQLDNDSLNKIGNATTRAWVLESDITDEQEKQARIARAARLGG